MKADASMHADWLIHQCWLMRHESKHGHLLMRLVQ